MKYTYDVIDKQSGKQILCDALANKVREALGASFSVSYYALNEFLYKGRYQITYNQYREETLEETFTREWEKAVRHCKKYPYLDRIQIKPIEK